MSKVPKYSNKILTLLVWIRCSPTDLHTFIHANWSCAVRSVSGSLRHVSCPATTSNQWWRSMCVDRPTGPGSRGETTLSLMRYSYLCVPLCLQTAQSLNLIKVFLLFPWHKFWLSCNCLLFSFKLCITFFVFLQMFFYNVHMLPSDLFEQNLSFRVNAVNVNYEVLSSVNMCERTKKWICFLPPCRCITPIHWGLTVSWEHSRYRV